MEGGGGGGEGKVRVVRCPKCGKLLPEPANFTVYRCGGCDATLQAKRPIPAPEASPEKSDAEVKNGVVSDASLEADPCRERIELRREGVPLSDKSARSEEGRGTEGGEGENRRPSKAPIGDPNTNSDELVNKELEESWEAKEEFEYAADVYRELMQKQARRRGVEMDGAAPRNGIRPTLYPDEGPSNYRISPTNRYGNSAGGRNPDGPGRIGHFDQDRAELLRKLDELRDQLSRSCEVTDSLKERAPLNRTPPPSSSYTDRRRGGLYPEGSSTLNHVSGRHSRFLNGLGMDRPNYIAGGGIHAYREAFGPQLLGRAPFHHSPTSYPQRPVNNYLYGQLDPDPVISYHHDGFYHHDDFYHQPACSCLHCYNSQWLPPSHVPPPIFSSNQRVPYPVNNHSFYPVDGPSIVAPLSFNQRVPNATLHSREPRVQKRATFTKGDGRSCRPIVGAAPFIVCYNCLKLLQIPEDIFIMEKNRQKLRCGSCRHVTLLAVDGRRLIATASAPTLQAAAENNNAANDGMAEDLDSHDHVNRHPVISYSEDFDSADFDIAYADEKLVLQSLPFSSQEMIEKEYGLNLSESDKMQGLSFSSSTSENRESPDSMICQRDMPSSVELPLEVEPTSQVSSLPLQDHFVYPPSNQVFDRSRDGSRSKRSEEEKVVTLDANFKQKSVKDVTVATEMDFSADENLHTGLSQDSWEADKDEDETRISKGGESFFAGLIKKSFKDFSRFNQSTGSGRSKVSINGHPVSDRIIKKAEKLVGPIVPGEYWYDYRAGFWGVMGHQCLGIIPPFIEEFNYPMPKNCAGGYTDVFVNGRELHQKDLDLLICRGLPATEGRSYLIEISGKVWDEASGEELDSLGKLAPTVEKVRRGFGMRIPRVHA